MLALARFAGTDALITKITQKIPVDSNAVSLTGYTTWTVTRSVTYTCRYLQKVQKIKFKCIQHDIVHVHVVVHTYILLTIKHSRLLKSITSYM